MMRDVSMKMEPPELYLVFPVFAVIAALRAVIVAARSAASVVTAGSADARHLPCVHTAILENPGPAASEFGKGAIVALGGVGTVLAATPAGLAGELTAVTTATGEALDSWFNDANPFGRRAILAGVAISCAAGIFLLVTARR